VASSSPDLDAHRREVDRERTGWNSAIGWLLRRRPRDGAGKATAAVESNRGPDKEGIGSGNRMGDSFNGVEGASASKPSGNPVGITALLSDETTEEAEGSREGRVEDGGAADVAVAATAPTEDASTEPIARTSDSEETGTAVRAGSA
jgi:hypothetical protein